MVKEARGFGATIDEAKENAILELNASELEDIQFEVISMPKKKVLGIFGGSRAEVRAFVEVADKKVKAHKKSPAKPQPQKNAPVAKKENANKKKAVENSAKEKVTEAKATVVKEEKALPDYGEPVSESEVSADSHAGKAIAYIRTVLSALNCKDIDIKVASRENASLILLNGEDLSVIIGRRGETLDALQYLTSLAANNGGGHYKISINIGNYREKREETLTNLAKKISAQVLKTEPMNPYERRIIHTAVQAIDGVVSTSFGEGTGRRVVVSLEGAEVRPPRVNDRRRGGGRPRSRRPEVKASATAPIREPKRDSDTPLYGKIN